METLISTLKSIKKINKCPCCAYKNFKILNEYYFNRYTEEFSSLLNVNKDYLHKYIFNVECYNCGLIYKKNWFKKDILINLYQKKVPIHPSGWDVGSSRFSKRFIRKRIDIFLKEKNDEKKKILKRVITSVVNAIKCENSKKKIKFNFIEAINKDNIKKITLLKNDLISILKAPEEYSRFKGFSDVKLLKFIISNVKNIKNYAEIGCPAWGLFDLTKKFNLNTYFIKPDKNIFWSENCKFRNLNCYEKFSSFSKILENLPKIKKFDYIGVYGLLDHYENLDKIFKKLFICSNTVGIITEDINKNGVPIQHSLGLTNKSLRYIALKYKKRMINNFLGMKDTRYNFFLFL